VSPYSPPTRPFETLQERGIAVASTSRELARERAALSEAARTTCDRARLTRAWSRELRRRRGAWCAWCRKPFPINDPVWTANYVPAGETVDGETVMLDQRCIAAWISDRVRPAPWLNALRAP
jgi:hypothetical protein